MPELEKEGLLPHESEPQNLDHLRVLIRRLQTEKNAPLDDMTVEALAETTGTSPEYIRIAMQQPEEGTSTKKLSAPINEIYYSFDPNVRTPVACALLGGIAGLFNAIARATTDPFSFWGMLMLIVTAIALVPVVRARDQRGATLGGAAYGGMMFFGTVFSTIVASIFSPQHRIDSAFGLVLYAAVGAVAGAFAYRVSRQKFGIQDNRSERQELLSQLMDLQKKLTANEEKVAFLSVDIVGSTAMKLGADPLAIEFTFTEYHKYVEMIVAKNSGKIHSTAGDGVTAVFDDPAAGFQAARTLQRGLPEFNTFRNRLPVPIQLRAGLHYGSVVAPEPGATSVNFSHVIDHAAHLQKECPISGVMVSETAVELIPNGNFESTTTSVDGLTAYTWLPRVGLPAQLSPATPPPMPGSN